MKKYRRIEVNAYHRRVTVVSGEWRPDEVGQTVSLPSQANSSCYPETDDGVLLHDSDACEPVAPDSPEGQLILAEAVRTLEQRLTPETRATICAGQETLAPNRSFLARLCSRLRSLFQPKELHLSIDENPAAKQSRLVGIPLVPTVADNSLQLSRPEK